MQNIVLKKKKEEENIKVGRSQVAVVAPSLVTSEAVTMVMIEEVMMVVEEVKCTLCHQINIVWPINH